MCIITHTVMALKYDYARLANVTNTPQCTVASKILVLSESVRDAADLYLSVKYQPIILINDSPCGFVRHLECRDAERANQLWGEFSGCFQRPKYATTIRRVRK